MGQYWQLFNASKREYMEVSGGLKFGEFFWTKQEFLVRSLSFPKTLPALAEHIKAISNRPPVVYEEGLLSLPTDILRSICSQLRVDVETLTALAVTCHDMYHLCEPTISEALQCSSARWANCRIACVGDYADPEDFPESLLSAGDRAFLEAELSKGVDLSHGGLGNLCGTESWVYKGPYMYWMHDEICRWLQRFSKTDLKMWQLVLGITFPSERKDWVLCNNTKKEYVRASVIARLAGRPDDLQPFLPRCGVDLGHVLLMRISWSRDDSMSMAIPDGMDLHRGKWVGDRLSITTMDRMDETSEGVSDWKDVSDEVVRELIQLLESSHMKDLLKNLEY